MVVRNERFNEELEQANRNGEQGLIEPAENDVAGGGIATGEVRVVAPVDRGNSFTQLILILLLLLILLGGVLVLWKTGLLGGKQASIVVTEVIQTPPVLLPVERSASPTAGELSVPAASEASAVAVAASTEVHNSANKEPVVAGEQQEDAQRAAQTASNLVPAPQYVLAVGPFLTLDEYRQAGDVLRQLGFTPQETRGPGQIQVVRLREGRYPEKMARVQLAKLKKRIDTAFLLPDGKRWALYAGSFGDQARAAHAQKQLATNGIRLTAVDARVEVTGRKWQVVLDDQHRAEVVKAKLLERNLQAQLTGQ